MRLLSIMTTSLTLFFIFLFLSIHLQAYTPEDNFTINWGTTGIVFNGERTWTRDADTKYLSGDQGRTILTEAATQDPSVNQVPYTTARLSRSQFNYFFPVSASPKFIRLFFYLAYYPSFPHTDASFSVQSNGFTFLKGFNASLNADTEATKKWKGNHRTEK